VIPEPPDLGGFVDRGDGPPTATIPSRLLFEFDSAHVRAGARRLVANLVPTILDTRWRVEVIGLTDGVGREAYNRALSLRRARAVVRILVSQGCPRSWIRAFGRGEAGATDDVRDFRRRRVEIRLINDAA
jgi:outer membrane protein OmpA-like peptidoglycan-associated protein